MSKIALITGANRGLGRNTALSIARRGGDIIIAYRKNADEAEAVAAEIQSLGRKAIALQLDMAQKATFPGLPKPPKTSSTGCSMSMSKGYFF